MAEAEVRSVMVPLTGNDILIPNATVAEVISYSAPKPMDDAPEWLLGTIVWRGWQVPVISYGRLTNVAEQENTSGARLCITKSLTNTDRMPYIAILAQGFPRLTTVTEAGLTEVPMEEGSIGVLGKVILGDREALVPDLDRVGQLVAHAAFGALPLTT